MQQMPFGPTLAVSRPSTEGKCEMKLPEFTAEASLYDTGNRYHSLAFDRTSRKTTVVIPQLRGPGAPGPGSCISDCADRHPGWTKARCKSACRAKDGSCTPHDNSLNRALCINGISGWEKGSVADCATLSGAGILGAAAAIACAAGVRALADQKRSDCDPAVICT